jgi:pyridoxal phosphate enzyme (YggS family)
MSQRAQEVASNLNSVEERINGACRAANRERSSVKLIAVTKTYPSSDVEILRSLGVTNFGENRDDEGAKKSQAVDAHWHFQGQIQSKKLRSISSWAHTIHSIDNLEHLDKLNRSLAETGKSIEIFLQLSLDSDPHRGGVGVEEILSLATSAMALEQVTLAGLMCVPPADWEYEMAFDLIAQKAQLFAQHFPASTSISAGMSGDFETAIRYGATHIRIGSQILGSRTYPQ